MLYNTKALLLHCVFHGIRFKVNEDWVSVIDTLLFFMKVAGCGLRFSAATPRRNKGYAVAAYPSFLCLSLNAHARGYPEGGGDGRKDGDGDVENLAPDFFVHSF